MGEGERFNRFEIANQFRKAAGEALAISLLTTEAASR
jgi:hypothetical protein